VVCNNINIEVGLRLDFFASSMGTETRGRELGDKFPPDAADEIKRFRREIVERSGQLAEELQALSIYSIVYVLNGIF
jgi:hypothetical protein